MKVWVLLVLIMAADGSPQAIMASHGMGEEKCRAAEANMDAVIADHEMTAVMDAGCVMLGSLEAQDPAEPQPEEKPEERQADDGF